MISTHAFRTVFEERMISEGFVWKSHVYMHVDFEQGWLIAFWPNSYSGERFDLQFGLYFLNSDLFAEDIIEKLNILHQYQTNQMFRAFDFQTFDNHIFHWDGTPIKAVALKACKLEYQRVLNEYCINAAPYIHAIHTPYEAYQFKKKYCFPFKEMEQLNWETGKEVIDYLLYIGEYSEALSLFPKITNRYQFLLKHESEYLDQLRKEKSPDLGYWEQKMPEVLQKLKKTLIQVEQIENDIRQNKFVDRIIQTQDRILTQTEALKSVFTQKQQNIMRMNWNNPLMV